MNTVCVVIVTYYPRPAVLANLAAVRPQVQGLLVVDNGSPEQSLTSFKDAARTLDFTLIRNSQNLGVAAALNIGVRWAKSHGFDWVALFDQDSRVTDCFIETLLETYESHPFRSRVAIVTSSHLERGISRKMHIPLHKDGGPLTAITSGSLIPMRIFDECGLFEDDLIIDCVDDEFCLRARALGFTIAYSERAVLLISVGVCEEHRVFGKRLLVTHHSARRRYYMTRNRLVVIARRWKQQPLWCFYNLRATVLETVTILLYERQRWGKLVHSARGVCDALVGRMGKVVEL